MNEELSEFVKELDEKKMIDLNSSIIKASKQDILKNMGFIGKEIKTYQTLLKDYRFIDELDELSLGHHIRWFNITRPDHLVLNKGAMLTKIEYKNNEILLLCKGYNRRYFQLKMNDLILFLKFTSQEIVLISILDYIQENHSV